MSAGSKATQFRPGQSGNPAGRKKGSRNKLGEAFLKDLHKHWKKNGTKALDKLFAESPEAYVKSVIAILPKNISLTDDEGNAAPVTFIMNAQLPEDDDASSV